MTAPRPPVRQRSWLEIRWRQLRNPPAPVLRAVMANLVVAGVAGAALLAHDATTADGAGLGAFALFVVVVVSAGTLFTYLWVPLPTGSTGRRRRSGWSGLLGFFTSLPIVYLVLVVGFQIIRPAL